MADNKRKPTFT